MTVNISYIALRGDVTENYTKTKKNWKHKEVQWNKLKNVLSNSRIQFSPYSFRNGVRQHRIGVTLNRICWCSI